MKNLGLGCLTAILSLSAGLYSPASAGEYSDALTKCLTSATTSTDKITLVRWVYSGLGLHPELSQMSLISTEQRQQINKSVASLLERLISQSCRSEIRAAIQNEGSNSFGEGFRALGENAAGELRAHESVRKGMSEFAQYLNLDVLKDIFPRNKN